MENAAEALKLAAWILIFVVALSISMSSFGQAKESIDTLLVATDREYITEYLPESGDTQRIVGVESIIPAIYRSFKDNYKIVFPFPLYKYKGDDVYYIDLSVNGFTDRVKEEFIKRVLYGGDKYDANYTTNHFRDYVFYNNSSSLYNRIKGKTFKEKLGIKYMGEENGATLAPDVNKVEKRIITYEEVE